MGLSVEDDENSKKKKSVEVILRQLLDFEKPKCILAVHIVSCSVIIKAHLKLVSKIRWVESFFRTFCHRDVYQHSFALMEKHRRCFCIDGN